MTATTSDKLRSRQRTVMEATCALAIGALSNFGGARPDVRATENLAQTEEICLATAALAALPVEKAVGCDFTDVISSNATRAVVKKSVSVTSTCGQATVILYDKDTKDLGSWTTNLAGHGDVDVDVPTGGSIWIKCPKAANGAKEGCVYSVTNRP